MALAIHHGYSFAIIYGMISLKLGMQLETETNKSSTQ